MTETINFPMSQFADDSEWGMYSTGMRQSMMEAGFTAQDTEEFLQHFEAIFMRYDFNRYNGGISVDIPDEYIAEFHKYSSFLSDALGRFTSDLIAERFGLELELFVNGKIALKSLSNNNDSIEENLTFREQLAAIG